MTYHQGLILGPTSERTVERRELDALLEVMLTRNSAHALRSRSVACVPLKLVELRW